MPAALPLPVSYAVVRECIMFIGRTALLILAASLSVGCRNSSQFALVEREHRHLEDRIYQLQDYIEQYQQIIESCQRENRTLKAGRRGTGEMDFSTGSSPRPMPPASSEAEPFTPPELDIDPGTAIEPQELPLLDEESEGSADGDDAAAPELPGPDAADLDSDVHKIVLNKLLSGGLDFDGNSGDEGIMAVLEPRDAQGKTIEAVGDVSLMVLDPNLAESEQRVARWDFSSTETATAWRKSLLGKGLHFELPWPADPPQGEKLQLVARLVTPDGRKHLTSIDFQHDPRGVAWKPSRDGSQLENLVASPAPAVDQTEWKPSDRTARASVDPVSSPEPGEAITAARSAAGKEETVRIAEPPEAAAAEHRRAARTAGHIEPPAEPGTQRPEWRPYR